MVNYNNIIKKAVEEDARKGKAQVRILSFPKKAKRKSGEDIHKLPAAFPIIDEYEKSFKESYQNLMNKFVINKLKKILK